MAKKKSNGFTSKFSDEQKQMMEKASEKGISADKLQELLELVGDFAPVFYSALMRLVNILQDEEPVEKAYGSVGECPKELAQALCDNEQAALESLAYAMMARHLACCDHHYDV